MSRVTISCKHARVFKLGSYSDKNKCLEFGAPPGCGNFVTFVHELTYCRDCGALKYGYCDRENDKPGTKRARWYYPSVHRETKYNRI